MRNSISGIAILAFILVFAQQVCAGGYEQATTEWTPEQTESTFVEETIVETPCSVTEETMYVVEEVPVSSTEKPELMKPYNQSCDGYSEPDMNRNLGGAGNTVTGAGETAGNIFTGFLREFGIVVEGVGRTTGEVLVGAGKTTGECLKGFCDSTGNMAVGAGESTGTAADNTGKIITGEEE
ncbi:MAG: hypothetical protein P9M13_08500 [Candidatus Ancaeobacter aquaticus]|nr:hypothetical protein [Candidatus Ancaeobacter aquaticus]